MQKVYVGSDRLLIGFLQQLLAARGIDCLIKNEYLAGGSGDIPPLECEPELWSIRDADAHAARLFIQSVLHSPQPGSKPWDCPRCGEHIEAQFMACWRCAEQSCPP